MPKEFYEIDPLPKGSLTCSPILHLASGFKNTNLSWYKVLQALGIQATL
jgi:hypothetical protein